MANLPDQVVVVVAVRINSGMEWEDPRLVGKELAIIVYRSSWICNMGQAFCQDMFLVCENIDLSVSR